MAIVDERLHGFEASGLESLAPPILPMSQERPDSTLFRSQNPSGAFRNSANAAARLLRDKIRSGPRMTTGIYWVNVPLARCERAACNDSVKIPASKIELILSALFHDVGHLMVESALAGAIDEPLHRLCSTAGIAKALARTEAVQAIMQAGASTTIVDQALRSIIDVHRSGRLDDAIDILSELGRTRIHDLAAARLGTFPPDGTNDDYWYAIIRAAGRLGDRQTVETLLSLGNAALKEAAIEALGDIGGSEALGDLRRLSGDSNQPEFIRKLAEEVASDLAANDSPDSSLR